MIPTRPKRPLRLLALLGLAVLVVAALLAARPGPAASDPPRPSAAGSSPAPALPGPTPRPSAPAPGAAAASGAAAGTPRVTVALRAPWGSGPTELGHRRPAEGNPEGPMSLAVDAAGRIVVLDQVNGRVQRFVAGRPVGSVALPADTYQDLDVAADGSLVLLDRLSRQTVTFLGPDGQIAGEVPLAGAGVPEGGGVTGLFARADGTWVEVEHRGVVRVADARGGVDLHRPTAPGRPSADGSVFLRAARDGRFAAVVLRAGRDAAAPQPFAHVSFPAPVLTLTGLAADRQGRVFLAATLLRHPADEGSTPDEADVVVILGPDGVEVGRVTVPPRRGPEETFRPLRLGADGAVYQMSWDDLGVTVWRIVP